MTVYRSVQHECLFAQEVADGAKGPAQYLRLCNVLCWIAGTVALASTVDDIHPLLVAGSLGLISSALELTGWRQLRLVSCWHRQESIKCWCNISVMTLVMVGHQLQPYAMDRLVHRSYFCAGSRAILTMPDQLRIDTSWKLHMLECLAFAIMMANRAFHMDGLTILLDTIKFVVFAIIPVIFISFMTELRARQQFASSNAMTPEEVGAFWERCFHASQWLRKHGRTPFLTDQPHIE